MTKELQLTQVVGKKIDPKSKYLFMFDGRTPYNQVEHFTQEMTRLLGANNFAVVFTNGNPKKALDIFEIKDELQVSGEEVTRQLNEALENAAGPAPFDTGYPGGMEAHDSVPRFPRTKQGPKFPTTEAEAQKLSDVIMSPDLSGRSENEA